MSEHAQGELTGAGGVIHQDIAVIDVGSNSIRLVHFRMEGRAIWPIFNEKVMAGLGEGVRQTGKLNPDGVEIALRALKRFQRILDAKSVSRRYIVATAAVREADDGPEFIARVARETEFEIRVLSGREEGELSALGLVTGIPDAHGVTGDLGGSSLELTPINHGDPGRGQTFALGPQAIMPSEGWDYGRVKALIDEQLAASEFLHGAGGRFYAVGGAWRALAQLAFAQLGHPLRVVHEFSLDRAQLRQLTRLITRLSPASLQGVPGTVAASRFALALRSALASPADPARPVRRGCVFGLRPARRRAGAGFVTVAPRRTSAAGRCRCPGAASGAIADLRTRACRVDRTGHVGG